MCPRLQPVPACRRRSRASLVLCGLLLLAGGALSPRSALGASVVVDWGGDYVTASQALAGGSGTTANGDFNGDTIALDQRRWVAFSLSSPRDPSSSYVAPPGKSETFYGGTMVERYGSVSQVAVDPFINTSVAVVQNAAGDRVRQAARDGSERASGVVLIAKADFLNGGNGTTISLDPTSNFTLTLGTISGTAMRLVVISAGTTYLSNSFTTNQTNTTTANYSWFTHTFDTANTAAGAGSMRIGSPTAAPTPDFGNVTALGYSLTSTASNNSVEISQFIVTAVPEPSTGACVFLAACFAAIRRRRSTATY